MTTAADDAAVEVAFEAFLAGRGVPEHEADLATFAGAVRSSGSVTGRPTAALAELLAEGLLVHPTRPSAPTTRTPGRPRASRARSRRRIGTFLLDPVARIASAGAVARAATGAGVVLVALSGAGTAGLLPEPLQHGFATVADAVGVTVEDPVKHGEDVPLPSSSTTVPDGTEKDGSATGADADEPEPSADHDAYTLEDWEAGPTHGQSFGDWVSEGARHGYADGAVISRAAHEKGVVLREGTPAPAADTAGDDEVTPDPRPNSAGNGHG